VQLVVDQVIALQFPLVRANFAAALAPGATIRPASRMQNVANRACQRCRPVIGREASRRFLWVWCGWDGMQSTSLGFSSSGYHEITTKLDQLLP
jgi:hypothetical protein